MPLTSIIATVPTVSDSQKDAMFRLHERYFANVDRDTFRSDLAAKDRVILLLAGRELVGFSTIQVLRLPVDGRDRVFLFSGDTIVDRAHWHDSTLAGSFGHVMLRLVADHPDEPCHWFLISKGYRTYRFLPVYFKRFYPVHSRPTPPDYARLLHAVATRKFGSAYDAQAGVVRGGGSKDRLKPELCEVPASRAGDAHVRFFLERNPTYARGDELACLADIAHDNLNAYAWRAIEHTTVRWHE